MIKAFITSIGEPTTDLCIWSLERNGFETELVIGDDSLSSKLEYIYNTADSDFVRIDSDIIVNKNFTPELLNSLDKNTWWWQFICFDWYKCDIAHLIAFIQEPAIKPLRNNIGRFLDNIRPETESSRIKEFYNPRRMDTYNEKIMGIHGYGIKDTKPVVKLKSQRGQSHLYDFELASELDKL